MPKMNLTSIDHDKDQIKFMRMQEIEKEAMEIHRSYGHFNANITIATARFHGRKISKALAKVIRKIKCADCALGHGDRKTIHTKRRPAEGTSGLSLADSDSDSDWFNEAMSWATHAAENTHLLKTHLPGAIVLDVDL